MPDVVKHRRKTVGTVVRVESHESYAARSVEPLAADAGTLLSYPAPKMLVETPQASSRAFA
jgi:hypothetical protein